MIKKIDLKNRLVWEIGVIIFIMLVGFFMLYKNETNLVANQNYYPLNNTVQYSSPQDLYPGDVMKQDFVLRYMDVPAIRVLFSNDNGVKSISLKAEMIEQKTKKVVGSWEIEADDFPLFDKSDNDEREFVEFKFEEPLQVKEQKGYTLVIEVLGDKKESIQAGFLWGEYKSQLEKFTLNGKKEVGLVVAVEMDNVINSNGIWVLYVVVFTILITALLIALHKKLALEKIFIILAAGLGVFYILILAPYSTPDEYKHIDTVFYHSSKILGTEAVDEDGNVMVRACDDLLQEDSGRVSLYTLDLEFKHLFEGDSGGELVSGKHDPLGTPVIGYIPQLIGVVLARLLGLGQIPMLILGRIFALALHIAFCYWAIKKMPFAKMLLFIVALLPMVLQQACSFSYDGIVNALAFFFVAYCLHLAYRAEKVRTKDIIVLMAVAAWLAPCKAVYCLICLVALIIPKEKFASKRVSYLIKGILLAVMAASLLIFNLSTLIRLLNPQRTDLLIVSSEAAYTTSDLLARPTEVLYMIWNSFGLMGDTYFFQIFGSQLSWLDININKLIIVGYVLITFLSVMKYEKSDDSIRVKDGLWFVMLSAGMTGGVFLAMLLDWTAKNSSYIAGVQGRYFLPFVPLLVILLRNNQIFIKKSIHKYLIYGLFLLQFFTIYIIIKTVICR